MSPQTTTQLLPRELAVRATARVLIVDDEPHVLAVGKAVLEAHGFDVTPAHSGEQALEMVRLALQGGNRFTAVILDLTMPGGASGFETLEWLRACDPALPVIACSGYFQEDVRELCQAIGFVDVLHKPFNIETLGLSVRRAMAPGSSMPLTGDLGTSQPQPFAQMAPGPAAAPAHMPPFSQPPPLSPAGVHGFAPMAVPAVHTPMAQPLGGAGESFFAPPPAQHSGLLPSQPGSPAFMPSAAAAPPPPFQQPTPYGASLSMFLDSHNNQSSSGGMHS